MNLLTQKGQLDLPKDFALSMERTNPLMSDQGDSSETVTLPSSTHNLAVLGHRERIDRAECYDNKVEAILQVGPVQKRGQLVIDTAHRRKGIAASFAIDNSDLYSTSKEKTLKEIFGDYGETFQSVQAACGHMQDVYDGIERTTSPYMVFPVAIAPYEKNGVRYYQYNNDVNDLNHLIWEGRNVNEGDTLMRVPDGYGIAPFLRLSKLVELLFYRLNYEVTENCLADWPFHRMVLVHNCSDCLVQPVLKYRDLVPSCKLKEFLEWLNNKLHVQPVVNSETHQVKIVAMETMLTASPDLDISKLVNGDFTVQLNPSKRVVLTPTNKIEGTEPAAATFDKLMEKYGHYAAITEQEFATLETAQPAYSNCLVMRKATGQFYMLEYDPNEEHQVAKLLGTNHFTYDRENSDESEDFSQADSLPLMLCVEKYSKNSTAPFIGERTHAHTTYNGSTADDKQDIILVQAAIDSRFAYKTTGTTQPYIPFIQPDGAEYFLNLGLGVCPYDLFDACWSRYNTLLLNHPTHFEGEVKYNIGQIIDMDMTRLKLCKGQHLMPLSASSSIKPRPPLTDAKFMLVKTFVDGVEDSPILPDDYQKLVWVITNNIDEVVEDLWISMGGSVDPSGFVPIDIEDHNQQVEAHYLQYTGYHVRYIGENPDPGTPQYFGEVKTRTRLAIVTIYYQEIVEYSEDCSPNVTTNECNRVFPATEVIFTYTADINRTQPVPFDARVEYLESTGTQYIDTGLVQKSGDFELLIEYQWTGSNRSAFETFFGYIKGSNTPRCAFNKYNGNWMFGTNATRGTTVQVDGNRHTAVISCNSSANESLEIDNVTILSETAASFSVQATNDKPFFVFARNGNGTAGNKASARIFSLHYIEFTDSTHAVVSKEIYLIPVRIGQTGYMYDRISGELFSNDGTGDFTLGPDIT